MKEVLYFMRKIHSVAGKVLYINLGGMVFISIFEGVGVFLLIPLLGLLDIKLGDSNEIVLVSLLSDYLQSLPESFSLMIILGAFVIIMIAQSIFQQSQIVLNAKIQQRFVRYLREETYKHIIQSQWSFFINKRRSDIVNLMTNEIGRVSSGTHLFLQFLTSLVFTAVQLSIAIWLSLTMTASVLFFGFILIYFSKRFVSTSKEFGNETLHLSKKYMATISDHFNGIKEIKSNTLEGTHFSWFRSLNKDIEENIIGFVKMRTVSQLIYRIVSSFLLAGFIFFSIKMFQAKPAQLLLIIVIFSRLWPRLAGIQSNLEQISSIIPSLNSVKKIQEECIREKENELELMKQVIPVIINKHIELRNINFRYNLQQPEFNLQEINLTLPINQMIAVIGHSGAGKSTLIDLLMGLNKPETGQILVDGVPQEKRDIIGLRHAISYVPQDPFLFNTTIRENLCIIAPDASDHDIWEALEFAAATEFVNKLPNGIDTLIGDRGIRLSGGERQRLVLARAILKRPSILVLDEATSALDSENEYKIQCALEKLKGKMTIVVIAHRLSTIKNADQVIVLDRGRIIQKGAFSELAHEQNTVFGSLLKKQLEAV
jgi:ABC-type multidrug transport system fused ATPase/permease subunit